MEIAYQELEVYELDKIRDIDRSDYSDTTYFVKESMLILEEKVFLHPGFSSRLLKKIVNNLSKRFKNGDIFIGAFNGIKLIGISGFENKFRGKNNDMVNFGPFWVSKDYRGIGIGRKLLEMTKNKAREMGAKILYISATPSKNTIDFYLGVGCRLTSEIDKELYEKEPYDIHVELEL